MRTKFERPFLSSVFNGLACLTIVGSIIGFVLGLVTTALAGLVAAFVYFGIAQAIEYLAQTAHNSERILALLEASAAEGSKTKPLPIPPTSNNPPPHSFSYFFERDGVNSGPHSLEQMLGFWRDGTLNTKTLVVREGDKEWRPFATFPEFQQ